MSSRKKSAAAADDEPKHLTVGSLDNGRHGLISSICKIFRIPFKISLDVYPHLATSLEKLRRKQLVTLLRAKIAEAALLGWVVIPLDASDLDDVSSPLDL